NLCFFIRPSSVGRTLIHSGGNSRWQVNEAQANFEKEAEKHRSYFQKHAISTLIYTDKPLADIPTLFGEVEKYLTLKPETRQLEFQLMAEFL
ncbi:hypothetical protein, partial [Sinorhizobium alkalisoli]|uniref:hypothetical protein n=1 Tax=Sinorhizobium alkalisoli TaxID=1752398 RepID=UPI001A96EFDD